MLKTEFIPKDIQLYVNQLIHGSLMKELLQEYHSKYVYCAFANSLLQRNGRFSYNYRKLFKIGGITFHYKIVYKNHTHNITPRGYLPKRYFFSSGMNRYTGYFENE